MTEYTNRRPKGVRIMWNENTRWKKTDLFCPHCGKQPVYKAFNPNPQGSWPLVREVCANCCKTFDL